MRTIEELRGDLAYLSGEIRREVLLVDPLRGAEALDEALAVMEEVSAPARAMADVAPELPEGRKQAVMAPLLEEELLPRLRAALETLRSAPKRA